MNFPKRVGALMQCIFLGGIVGAVLGPAVVITIGFGVIAVCQASGHVVVDNGFAPFAPMEFFAPWFWIAGPGAGVLTATVMWRMNGAGSVRLVALCTGLPIATLVASLATPGDARLWEQLWIGGTLIASTLSTAMVSAWTAKYT